MLHTPNFSFLIFHTLIKGTITLLESQRSRLIKLFAVKGLGPHHEGVVSDFLLQCMKHLIINNQALYLPFMDTQTVHAFRNSCEGLL